LIIHWCIFYVQKQEVITIIDLEQLVQTTWCSANKDLYVSKGYVYTKMFDKFYVHAKDLPLKYAVKVKYTCNACREEFEINYYSFNISNSCLCNHCATKTIVAQKLKKPFSDVRAAFLARGYILISPKGDYRNSTSKLVCTCKVHGEFTTTYQSISMGQGCPQCAIDNHKGLGNPNYKGGITEIAKYLRNQLSPWIQQQLQRAGCKCEITGKTGILNVHHMYSFKNILDKTMEELNIDIRPNIGNYSGDELQLITVNFLKNNILLAKPIVMLESIHRDFHKFCGGTAKETTYAQLREFKKQLLSA
jgi:hypothetical protein